MVRKCLRTISRGDTGSWVFRDLFNVMIGCDFLSGLKTDVLAIPTPIPLNACNRNNSIFEGVSSCTQIPQDGVEISDAHLSGSHGIFHIAIREHGAVDGSHCSEMPSKHAHSYNAEGMLALEQNL